MGGVSMGKTMKVISSLRFKRDGETRYSVHFDDGITIIARHVDDQFEYVNMLSVGADTYFTRKHKWPDKRNINTRMQHVKQFMERNIKNNRYKKQDK